jgi:hypothetical protein
MGENSPNPVTLLRRLGFAARKVAFLATVSVTRRFVKKAPNVFQISPKK